MATSAVEIINSALIKVGASPISSLSDQSKEAEITVKLYDTLRKDLLASHKWNFALVRVELSPTATEPLYEFSSEFVIPSDCLRVLEIDNRRRRFSVERNKDTGNRVILSDEPIVKIKYISDIEDVTQFSATFVEVLALDIAYNIAYTFTNSQSLYQNIFALYEQKLKDARSFDAQEGTPQQVEADLYLDIRRS